MCVRGRTPNVQPVAALHGFAIGTIRWQEPMEAHLRGELARPDAVAEIGRRYRELVAVWSSARTASVG